MTDKVKFKAFPTAFKLAAIKRLEAGEAVLPLARKLGVSRKVLHDWRKAWKLHGPAGLNRKRGPKPGPRKLRPLAGPAATGSSGELAQARATLPERTHKAVPCACREARVAAVLGTPHSLTGGLRP
jgi:transposase-like protein